MEKRFLRYVHVKTSYGMVSTKIDPLVVFEFKQKNYTEKEPKQTGRNFIRVLKIPCAEKQSLRKQGAELQP